MDAILTRRTIRKFKDKAVSESAIQYLLEAAMSAPSMGKQEAWHFMVITGRELLDRAGEAHKHAPMMKKAPAAILVAYDETLEHHKGYAGIDCAAATENILIAANGKKLGAAWLSIYPEKDKEAAFRKLLGLPKNIVPFALIAIGHPDEEKLPKSRFVKSRVHYNKW